MTKKSTIPLELHSLLTFLQKQGHTAEIQEANQQIYLTIQAGSHSYAAFCRIFEETGLLQILAFFPCVIDDKSCADMGRLLHMFNKELDLPGFGMDELAGVVFFRWMFPTQERQIPEAVLLSFLSTLKTVCQSFTPVIQAVGSGAIQFETLLEKARSAKK